jgi:methylated-DNA-protein-cysteine methyltransferase-like protein
MRAAARIDAAMRFRAAVYRLVRRVPRGQVVTYGQVAVMVGHDRAARAVGGAMRQCPDDVPWHRVVNAQGGISRRRQSSGMLTQRIRLEQEGVRLRRGRVPLARYQWESPRRVVTRVVNGLRAPRERGVMGGPGRPSNR